MSRFVLTFILLSMMSSAGCSVDKGKDIYDMAQFEEKQHNNEHARQLYEEIAKKYPGTEFATKATQRLQEIPGK